MPLLLSTPTPSGSTWTTQHSAGDIVRTHARTFWLASQFLPHDKRRSAFALYAFCRVADDLVDRAGVELPG